MDVTTMRGQARPSSRYTLSALHHTCSPPRLQLVLYRIIYHVLSQFIHRITFALVSVSVRTTVRADTSC
jgi:hypothetical protein